MANSKSGRAPLAEEWEQVALLTTWPEQRAYEVIRPVVLFGRSPAARARETGTPRSSLYRQAAAFAERGMASLFAPPAPPKHRTLPPEIRQAILALKAEHPAFRPREITRICTIRFGRSLSHHTVQRILAEGPLPVPPARRFPPYQQIADPTARRLAIIRLHAEGWNAKSIAQYLGTSRQTVHTTLRRWIDEGVLGLDDKSHARKDGVRKVDLRAIAACPG
jgi:putative transposase